MRWNRAKHQLYRCSILEPRLVDAIVYELSRSQYIVRLTHLINGTGQSQVPVLAVHVVRSRPGIITQPDAVILHHPRVRLLQLNEEQVKNIKVTGQDTSAT